MKQPNQSNGSNNLNLTSILSYPNYESQIQIIKPLEIQNNQFNQIPVALPNNQNFLLQQNIVTEFLFLY